MDSLLLEGSGLGMTSKSQNGSGGALVLGGFKTEFWFPGWLWHGAPSFPGMPAYKAGPGTVFSVPVLGKSRRVDTTSPGPRFLASLGAVAPAREDRLFEPEWSKLGLFLRGAKSPELLKISLGATLSEAD